MMVDHVLGHTQIGVTANTYAHVVHRCNVMRRGC
jgi:hypothetical protein